MNSDRHENELILSKVFSNSCAIGSATIYCAIIFSIYFYWIVQGTFSSSINAVVNFLGITTDPIPLAFIRDIFFALALVQVGAILVAILTYYVCYIHYMIKQKTKRGHE